MLNEMIQDRDPDRRLIRRILLSLPPQPTATQIIKATSVCSGFTEDELRGASRLQPLCHVRQLAMALTRELKQMSFPDIGRRYGGRDHTTVLHAFNQHKTLLRECINAQPQFIEEVEEMGHA